MTKFHSDQPIEGVERSLLGHLLAHPPGIADALEVRVNADDFLLPGHAVLWRRMVEGWEAGIGIDAFTLASSLRASELDLLPGRHEYFIVLHELGGVGAGVRQYAQQVRDAGLLRRLATAAERIAYQCRRPDGPAEEIVSAAERDILAVSGTLSRARLTALSDLIPPALLRITDRVQGGGEIAGTPTGFPDLDLILGGLRGGELIILAARPGVGKTTLAVGIAANLARDGKSACVISLEQSSAELVDRLIAAEADIPAYLLRQGGLSEQQLRGMGAAANRLQPRPLWVCDEPNMRLGEIGAIARRLIAQHNLRLLVVDYLQLVTTDDRTAPRHEQVGDISRRLKLLSRSLDLPILCLCQLNRASEQRADKLPMLSDLRESGSIEQDADIVILLHRGDTSLDLPVAEVSAIVAKNRHGPTDVVRLGFHRQRAAFVNLEHGF